MKRAVVYGDINPNIIDGSSVWLASITEVLSRVFDEVHLLLKAELATDVVIARLTGLRNVVIHPPTQHGQVEAAGDTWSTELTVPQARARVADLTTELNATTVVARGLELCWQLSDTPVVASRLWAYVTDLPYPISRISVTGLGRLDRIARRCQLMFVQTEAARDYLEALVPATCGKTRLLPPMIPDDEFLPRPRALASSREPLHMIYSGKFARDWQVLEMLDLPRALAGKGVDADLWMVGSKFQRDPEDPSWRNRMHEQLERCASDPTSGVRWLGGVTRAESLALMKQCDLGIGWRSAKLDGTLEVSTKALEYGAAGLPCLMNRTMDAMISYGDDYPLWVDSRQDVEGVAGAIVEGLPRISAATERCMAVSRYYSMSNAVRRFRSELFRTQGENRRVSRSSSSSSRLKVGVASHDLKFMGELLAALRQDPGIDLRVDQWETLHTHDEAQSASLRDWADVVLCEWAGPNAVWYSQNKKPGQRLVVRLHRFELGGPWLSKIQTDAIDALVLVSEYFREKALAALDISPKRAKVIPNMVDVDDLARPKLSGCEFQIGLMGWVSFGKRPDRAVELVRQLVELDDRYVLHIKGRMPWEYSYEWNNALQRQLYLEFLGSISQTPILRDHVVFERFSADVGAWFRRIGFILSPSEAEFESFHLAPAEGMASGSVPLIWPRGGAEGIFGDRWIFRDEAEMAQYVLELRESGGYQAQQAAAMEYARRWSPDRVIPMWADVLAE